VRLPLCSWTTLTGAARYYSDLRAQVGSKIFTDNHKLEPYYVSAYAYYKLEFLFRDNLLPMYYKPCISSAEPTPSNIEYPTIRSGRPCAQPREQRPRAVDHEPQDEAAFLSPDVGQWMLKILIALLDHPSPMRFFELVSGVCCVGRAWSREETGRVLNSRSGSSAPAGYRFPREFDCPFRDVRAGVKMGWRVARRRLRSLEPGARA
jgi:hypothetical protein